ncbi:MAG TPA: acyltransferase [Planctomycetota bacterium]|nr:acyltransferase [Planctomycetota bacterium]
MSGRVATELEALAREREVATGRRPGTLALGPALLARLATGASRLVAARLWLRRARLGRRVRVRGRPLLEGLGTFVIEDDVAIWSHLARTQLSAGPGATLRLGAGTFVNTGASISARASVDIGRRCQIANHVAIMDSDFHGLIERDQPEPPAPIVIEDDVWLAVRSTVLKGVRIGRGAVVAAGAVVVSDVPPYALVAGVPARVVRTLRAPERSP